MIRTGEIADAKTIMPLQWDTLEGSFKGLFKGLFGNSSEFSGG